MSSIVDLDSNQCSFDPLEALEYLKGKQVTFKISLNNPLLHDIKEKYPLQIIKVDGDVLYFKIQ